LQKLFPFKEKKTNQISLYAISLKCLSEWRVREKSDNKKHERKRSLEGRLEQQEKGRQKPKGREEDNHTKPSLELFKIVR